jgi:A/G-specific adenine glycosylase
MMNRSAKVGTRAYNNTEYFQRSLIRWFEENGRKYPWRNGTGPYEILLSEVLLQQTNADRVVDVYNQLIRKFPDPHTLALSEIDELISIMKPIGLNYKAARLKKLGEVIVNKYGGDIPSQEEELLSLLGVGQYIANAVLCFAFSYKVPLVDVNVLRMYERVFSLQSTKRRAREDPAVWQFAAKMLPDNFREYNWAVIDLCSKICTIRHPLCDSCPVSWVCCWLQSQRSLHGGEA